MIERTNTYTSSLRVSFWMNTAGRQLLQHSINRTSQTINTLLTCTIFYCSFIDCTLLYWPLFIDASLIINLWYNDCVLISRLLISLPWFNDLPPTILGSIISYVSPHSIVLINWVLKAISVQQHKCTLKTKKQGIVMTQAEHNCVINEHLVQAKDGLYNNVEIM